MQAANFHAAISIEAVKVGGKGRAAGARGNEQVADGREHTDKSP
jgi:hypothetical protein